jgi:hypothetical protein
VLVGAGAGALGFAAGFLVVAFAPAGGLGTAIIVGAISGGVGGGVTELAQQSLSGESINPQAIGAAMLSGVVSGGVLGGVGYGVGRAVGGVTRPPSNNVPSPTSPTSHEIERWGAGAAEEAFGIRTSHQIVKGRGGTPVRIYDATTPSGRLIELKISIAPRNVSPTSRIRTEIASDVALGRKPLWLFIGRGPSRGLQEELNKAGLEWAAQPFLPGVDWSKYFHW